MRRSFTVTVARSDDGHGDRHWDVRVDDKDGGEYAGVYAPDLDTALRMAVPYMAHAAQPNPLDGQIESVRQALGIPPPERIA